MSEEGAESPEADGFQWEQNLGPLQEQPMFFKQVSHLSTHEYQFF